MPEEDDQSSLLFYRINHNLESVFVDVLTKITPEKLSAIE